MQNILSTAVFTTLIFASTNVGAAESAWVEYPIPESGFKIALPTPPRTRLVPTPLPDETLRVYESFERTAPTTKYSIFVGRPAKQGIFDSESMDAYLSAHIRSMVALSENGKLVFSRRTTFRGRPALEYQFSHTVESQEYMARGVTLMIDGGHIRVSQWHPVTDPNGSLNFKRLLDSFDFIPIQYQPSKTPFNDPRGIVFTPPEDWVRQAPRNAVQAVRYTNLTRSMQLLVAGVPTYTCDTFQSEIQASGRLKSSSTVRLAEQQFRKLLAFEDVPKYKIRLTTVQYCLNSRLGAVVFGATEEESMYPRWERVFEGAAASVRIR